MNKLAGLFFGVFLLFGLSWLAFAAYPYITFAGLQRSKDEATGALAPPGNPGTADQGARVYAANGCFYCHSQYVRDKNEGSDIERKWGKRRTVARDYMFDRAVFLGTSRLGADLTNVGDRQTDPQWFYRLLVRSSSHWLLSRSCRLIDGSSGPGRSRGNHPRMPSSWREPMRRLPVMKWYPQRKEERWWIIYSH